MKGIYDLRSDECNQLIDNRELGCLELGECYQKLVNKNLTIVSIETFSFLLKLFSVSKHDAILQEKLEALRKCPESSYFGKNTYLWLQDIVDKYCDNQSIPRSQSDDKFREAQLQQYQRTLEHSQKWFERVDRRRQ